MTRAALWVALVCGACGGLPQTHHYVLVPPDRAPATGTPRSAAAVLTIEPFSANAAYAEERIAYRPSPYRLEHYNYHLWTLAPPAQVADYLHETLSGSGRFARVLRSAAPETTAILGGTVHALEEVDVTDDSWIARVDVELSLRAPEGELLWSRRFVETEPLDRRHPAGLARAASAALARISGAAEEQIAAALARPAPGVSQHRVR